MYKITLNQIVFIMLLILFITIF